MEKEQGKWYESMRRLLPVWMLFMLCLAGCSSEDTESVDTEKPTEAATPAEITEELEKQTNGTLTVTSKIDAADGNIAIPAETGKVGLNFVELPITTPQQPLTIVEKGTTEEAELNISIPKSTTETYLTLEMPTTTVVVKSGKYGKIIARTADHTLVLGADAEVKELVVLGGNVVLDGGKVASISRHQSNGSELTYVYAKGNSTLKDVTMGGGVVEPDYVTFNAESAGTFALSEKVETLEYSVDGGIWTELGTKTVSFGGDAGDLRLRGKSTGGTRISTSIATVSFGNSASVAASGDIRTLVDYEIYTSKELDTSKAHFTALFKDCVSLTSAPALPATKLADNCYSEMFQGCVSLTEAPALPAQVLAKACYQNMFRDCVSLTKAPVLPATTLAEFCYNSMFQGCVSLTEAPALPASNLADHCYNQMFISCASLTKAPMLHATTLTKYCYRLMFAECTSLTEAPSLPAMELTDRCYSQMFMGCTSLTKAPMLSAPVLAKYSYNEMFKDCSNLSEVRMRAVDISAAGCLSGWLSNVSPWGTLYKNSALEDISALEIPGDWEVKNW